MAAENLDVGPIWGGEGGNAWSYLPKGPITRISITYGDIIDSIRFTSLDESGNFELSDQFGSSEGSNKAEIEIDAKDEKLSSISGTYGAYHNMVVVTSLSFTTDKDKSYGPFGSLDGTAFSLKVTNESINGFYGRAGVFLDAIGVYVNLKAENVVVGPWGGQGGNAWSYLPKGPITCISITYGDIMDSIRFTSQDESGNFEHSDQFGSSVGSNKAKIEIDAKVEKLSGISGTFGPYHNMELVSTLSFATDKNKSYGPFGSVHGSHSSFKVTNESIVGFHGRAGVYLDAIGVYLKPKPVKVVAGPWGGQGGQPWSYAPKGPITRISITYGDVIDSIRFTSQDESGNFEHSDRFGSSEGSNKAEIEIDAKVEKINSVSGTFGPYHNMEVVSSLSFTTDKNKSYGPFGSVHEGAFSFKVANNSINGFHGRAGVFLDAIGVYGLDVIEVVVTPSG